jgi:hypothetical protein
VIFSSTACEDRALNDADAIQSYPALAPEPRLRHESDVFLEYDSAPAAQ